MKRKATDQQIIDAASQYASMMEAAASLEMSLTAFRHNARKLGVYQPNPNMTKGNMSAARLAYLDAKTAPLDEILAGKHPGYKGNYLKQRLYEAGIKQEVCEECGQGNIWNGKPLVLELEHINGDNTDHRLANLKILCMHCHSQTPTFRRRKSALEKK